MQKLYGNIIGLLFIILVSSFGTEVQAQITETETPEQKIYRIELKTGDVLFGEILKRNSEFIVFSSDLYGELTIPQKKIKDLRRYKERKKIKIREELDYLSQSNFMTPTGYNLRRGKTTMSNNYLFYNQVNYGITNHFQVGAGLEFLSMLFSNSPTYFVSVKANQYILDDKLKVSATGFFANGNLLKDRALGGMLGTATLGNVKSNISASIGTSYYNGSLVKEPILSVSAMKQITDKISVLSDNFYVPFIEKPVLFFSYGLRVYAESFAVNLYFINSERVSKTFFLGFPIIGATIPL